MNMSSTAGARDVVTYSIKINGETLPQSLRLLGMSVSHEVARIPCAKLVVSDGSAGEQDFPVSNESWFVPGNELEIHIGYRSQEEKIYKGVVVTHRLRVREGSANIEINCRDAAYRMTLRRQSRYFEELSDSDIAAQLIEEYGLSYDVDETDHQHQELVQYDVSDWDFLLMRMEFNSLITTVEGGEFKIATPDFEQEASMQLSYGSNVLEFDGDLEMRGQFEEVAMRSWDYDNQQVLELSASEPDIEANGNLSAQELQSANMDSPTIHRHGGNVAEGELQAWADARMLKDRLARMRGRVRFHGRAGIKPTQLIELRGFGERFNGSVFVAGVRHEYYQGVWLTDVEFGLAPEWFAEDFSSAAPPAAGMLGAVNGLQIAVVAQIEDDPGGNFRIRVRLPIVDNEDSGLWVRVATLDAGVQRGTVFLPEVDDEVIVGFINNDPRDAVMLGMLHSRSREAPIEASEGNEEKGYVSREGLRLIFNDEDKSISLQTPGGNSLLISDAEKGLVLADQNGNSLRLDDSGISIESEQALELKAKTNINARARNNCSIQAQSQAELKSNSTNTIQGNPVNIN